MSNLSAMISNARAYQHIQAQADKQERLNTELRQQRDELSVLNQALEEANKVRSEFLSTMSHELRTLLASIIGFSQMRVFHNLEAGTWSAVLDILVNTVVYCSWIY